MRPVLPVPHGKVHHGRRRPPLTALASRRIRPDTNGFPGRPHPAGTAWVRSGIAFACAAASPDAPGGRRVWYLRILLVDDDADRAALVAAGLRGAGYEVVALAPDVADLTRRVRDSGAEVIVCDLDDPSRDALESMRALNRDEPRPVVLFAEKGEPEQIEAALEAGVAAYVVEGLAPGRVRPVIEVAIRRFRAHHAMRLELEQTRATLAARSVIDRAKARLMERGRLSEEEAYRRLRRLAMDQGRKLADMAQEIMDKK